MAISEPSVTYLIDSYRFLWPELGVDILADRLHDGKEGLGCELTIELAHPPVHGLVRQGRFNMSAPRTRTEWVNALRREFDHLELPWYDLFEAVCALSVRRWRNGEPLTNMASAEQRTGQKYLLAPFVVEDGPSLLFADGGSGKSLLALAMAASVATGEPILSVNPKVVGPVAYLDWEWSIEEHAERLRAICAGAEISVPDNIYYRHEYASLNEAAPTLRRELAAKGVVMAVIDSLGFARGDDPTSAEATLKTFAAARTLDIPCLFIDHVSKESKDKRYSFGSVYTFNSVRASWRLDSIRGDSGITSMGMTWQKPNLGYETPRGFRMVTQADEDGRLSSVVFESTDYRSLPAAAKPTLVPQMIAVLREMRGPVTGPAMVAELRSRGFEWSAGMITKTLSERKDLFGNGPAGYTLLSHDEVEV